MKKIIGLIIAFGVIVLGLSSCGNKSKEESNKSNTVITNQDNGVVLIDSETPVDIYLYNSRIGGYIICGIDKDNEYYIGIVDRNERECVGCFKLIHYDKYIEVVIGIIHNGTKHTTTFIGNGIYSYEIIQEE